VNRFLYGSKEPLKCHKKRTASEKFSVETIDFDHLENYQFTLKCCGASGRLEQKLDLLSFFRKGLRAKIASIDLPNRLKINL